jgi:hypothetical protein
MSSNHFTFEDESCLIQRHQAMAADQPNFVLQSQRLEYHQSATK